MFGVLRIARDQLAPEQREFYRAHFCASCHAMREVSGRATSLLTNYDQTVLALVLGGLEGETRPRRSSCTALPLRTVPVHPLSDRAKELLAGLNLAAVEAKLRDDVQDERSLLARLGLTWLRRPAERAARRLGDRGFPPRSGAGCRSGRVAPKPRRRPSTGWLHRWRRPRRRRSHSPRR